MFVITYTKSSADDKWHEEGYFSTWGDVVSFVEKHGITNDLLKVEWVSMEELVPNADGGPVW
jgi:hypothetical protein